MNDSAQNPANDGDSKRELAISKMKAARRFISGLGQLVTDTRHEHGAESQRLGAIIFKIRSRFDTYKTLVETVRGDPSDPLAQRLVFSVLSLLKELETTILEFPWNDQTPPNENIDDQALPLALMPTTENIAKSRILDFYREASKFYNISKKRIGTANAAFISARLSRRWIETLLDTSSTDNKITREISFPPEFQQAGIGILSYFSKVLQTNYPDLDVGVTIQQARDSVTMIISHPDGKQEQITRTLHEYGLVVTGKMNVEDLINDPIQAMALKQKLELAHLEVRQVREILQLERNNSQQRIDALESDVSRLFGMLERKLDSEAGLQDKLLHLINSDEARSVDLVNATADLARAIQDRDPARVELMLDDLSVARPDLLSRMTNFIYSSAFSGVVGNTAFTWLSALWPTLPR